MAAFGKTGMAPNVLTEGQRLLTGEYKLLNGQSFKAAMFGVVEEGNSIEPRNKLDTKNKFKYKLNCVSTRYILP